LFISSDAVRFRTNLKVPISGLNLGVTVNIVKGRYSLGSMVWNLTARWLGLVAVRVRAGEFFAGHGRWNEIVTSR